MTSIKFWIVVILIVLAMYAIRYVVSVVVNKGADEISNAYKRKKNAENKDTSENLSDRYKK